MMNSPFASPASQTPSSFTRVPLAGVSACFEPLSPKGPPRTILDDVLSPIPIHDEGRRWARSLVLREEMLLAGALRLLDVRAQAEVLTELVSAHYILGELPAGDNLTEQALLLWERLGDGRRIIECLMGAGRCHQHFGDVPGTIAFYGRAVTRGATLPVFVSPMRYNVLMSLCQLHHYQEAFPQAVRRGQEALAAIRGQNQPQQEIMCLSLLAFLHTKVNQLPESLRLGHEALKLIQKAGAREMEEQIRILLSTVYSDLGDFPQAAAHEEVMLHWARQAGAPRPYLAERLVNAGMACMGAQNSAKAAAYLGEALPLIDALGNRALGAVVRCNLATLASSGGEPRRAMRLLEEALNQGPASLRPLALVGLGDACRAANEAERAVPAYREALLLARAGGDEPQVMRLLVSLGDALVEAKDPAGALHHYEEWLALRGLDLGPLTEPKTKQETKITPAMERKTAPAGDTTQREGFGLLERAGLVSLAVPGKSALLYFARMVTLARELGDDELHGKALLRRAEGHIQQGDGAGALADLEEAGAVFRAAGQPAQAEQARAMAIALQRSGEGPLN